MPKFTYNGTLVLSSSVKDLDASVAWFKEKLGFDLTFNAMQAGWAEVSTPVAGVTIGLAQSDEGARGSTAVFGVADIAEARAELEANDVSFEGDIVEVPGMVKLATFLDPDGNRYMLAESLTDE